jgi:hypothetical protein
MTEPGLAAVVERARAAEALRERCLSALARAAGGWVERLGKALAKPGSCLAVPGEAMAMWGEAVGVVGKSAESLLGACLLASEIARAPGRLVELGIPGSFFPHLAVEYGRMLREAEDGGRRLHALTEDVYRKDLAMAMVQALPAVRGILAMNAGISRAELVGAFRHAPRGVIEVLVGTRLRCAPMLESHVHGPMLGGFHEEGFRECYRLAADLLEARREHWGLFARSWFYDPVVAQISPRLGYIAAIAREGKAVLAPVRQEPADIRNATAKSATRRRLYEEGRYEPRGWLLVWLREKLIEWARRETLRKDARGGVDRRR